MNGLFTQTLLIILLSFVIGMAVALLIDLLVKVMDFANALVTRHEVIKRRRKIRKAWKTGSAGLDYLQYSQNKRYDSL